MELECEVAEWIHVAQDKVRWRTIRVTAFNLRNLKELGLLDRQSNYQFYSMELISADVLMCYWPS
jgi:hypothetical protein